MGMSNSMKSSVTARGKGAAPETYNEITSTQINSSTNHAFTPFPTLNVQYTCTCPIALTNVLQRSSPILLFNPLKIRLQRDTNEGVYQLIVGRTLSFSAITQETKKNLNSIIFSEPNGQC